MLALRFLAVPRRTKQTAATTPKSRLSNLTYTGRCCAALPSGTHFDNGSTSRLRSSLVTVSTAHRTVWSAFYRRCCQHSIGTNADSQGRVTPLFHFRFTDYFLRLTTLRPERDPRLPLRLGRTETSSDGAERVMGVPTILSINSAVSLRSSTTPMFEVEPYSSITSPGADCKPIR